MTCTEGDALAAGHAALREGRAEEARAIFAQAVSACGSAQAHEGLSWAALALDDAEATITARQTAYRLYRDAGAPVAAARMAMWLAKDHDDFRGAAALANGWLARARRLLADQPVAPEHGWLEVLACWGTTAHERNPQEVADGARRAIAVAQRCGDRDLELLGIAFEGLARVDTGRIAAGMAQLDETAAAVSAGELDEPLWALVIFCNLIAACERARDFARAAEWCRTMRAQADRMRHTGSQAICRAHYGVVLTHCGDWAGAEDALAEAVRCYEASWPPYRAQVLADLAELRRRQGRLGAAGKLLDAAAGAPREPLVRGRCALDLGDGAAARDCAERYLRRFPETCALHRVEGLELLIHASVAAGAPGRGEAALAELEARARDVATPPLAAMANAAGATLAAAHGRTARARAGFEDAVDGYSRAGMVYDAAAARIALAELLTGLDRADAARAEASGARRALEAMGAEHLARRAAALEARLARPRRAPASRPGPPALTARQVEVVGHVAAGLTNREIAAELALSEKTIDRHLSNAFDRLGVGSRAAAVAAALAQGLI